MRLSPEALPEVMAAIKDRFGSVNKFCQEYKDDGVDYINLLKLLNGKAPARSFSNRYGTRAVDSQLIDPMLLAVCDFLDLDAEAVIPGPSPVVFDELDFPVEPDEVYFSAEVSGLQQAAKQVLDHLTRREAKVLRMRFGIDMNTDHTLEEVGKQFDVTRERIRQIEAKALRKLRHPTRSDYLRSFLDEN